MLETLDKKDVHLLMELDKNSRASLSELGSKVHLSKSNVLYRIQRLKDRGIIRSFYTIINIGKLGLMTFMLYLDFQNATPEQEEEILSFLVSQKIVARLTRSEGAYDVVVNVTCANISQLHDLWDDLFMKFGNYITNRKLTITSSATTYSRAYFTGVRNDHQLTFITAPQSIALDDLDLAIINELIPDARKSVVSIATRCNVTALTVLRHMRELERKGVIVGYRTKFDLTSLGIHKYKLYFILHNHLPAQTRALALYIQEHPNIIYLVQSVGGEDVEIELEVRDAAALRAIIVDIKSHFAPIIREHFSMELHTKRKGLSDFMPIHIKSPPKS
jgi:DNA-binding Lrp family transcriptional regulator